jgi:hypothetical protein
LLDTYKLERLPVGILVLKTKFNYLSNALHQDILVLRLCVATAESWYGGDIVAILVLFDDDRKSALLFHGYLRTS